MLQKDFVKISWSFQTQKKKRKIIGREFVAVFDEESHKFEGAKFLASAQEPFIQMLSNLNR